MKFSAKEKLNSRIGNRLLSLLLIFFPCCWTGCGTGGGGGQETDPESLRVFHLATDVSAVDFELGMDAIINGVDYGQGTIYFEVTEGTLTFAVNSETRALPLYSEDLTIEADSTTTAVFTRTSDALDVVTFTDDNSPPNSGKFRIRLGNFAASEDSVDVYILPAGESVKDHSPDVSATAFQSFSDYLSVNSGTFQIKYTDADSKNVIRETEEISFSEGAVYSHLLVDDSEGGRPLSSRLFLDAQY